MMTYTRLDTTLLLLALASIGACNGTDPTDTETASASASETNSDEVATQGESASETGSSSAGSTESESDSSTADTTESDSSTADTTETDSTTDTGVEGCVGACGSPGCSPCPDAPGVDIPGGYKIDSTEVRNADYALFLAEDFAPGFVATWLPDSCAWKTDFTPNMWDDNLPGTLPVVGVDWCDAWAYCAWTGQGMCGAVGGGPTPLDKLDSPAASQWVRACTGGGLTIYPYGLSFDPDACNGIEAGFDGLVGVGTLAGCEGGYPGTFDFSGNVWEWENACMDDPMIAVDEQLCQIRGGSYFSIGQNLRCATDLEVTRDFRNHHTGIRCCG